MSYNSSAHYKRAVVQDAYHGAVNGLETKAERVLQGLVRPSRYKNHRPTFYSAYARAAHRYEFDGGKYAGFAKRNNAVVKISGLYDKSAHHEVPAESIHDGPLSHRLLLSSSEYVVPVTVGTPGITVNLDFDTGSSDLWIWSSELAGASRYRAHRIYDPYKSRTARHAQSLTWNISYGDSSSASGDVYMDSVTVAGVTVPSQALECARQMSSAFLKDGGNDGLVGLAWPSINTVKPQRVKTLMETMIEQRLIPEALFTVRLGHGQDPSFYSFGYIDRSATSNAMYWTPVDNSKGFWQVPASYYSINRKIQRRPHNTAILDTGTSLLLVHDDVVENIYHHVDGAIYDEQEGGWKYPSNAQTPDVWFSVGDRLFVVHPADFGFGPANDGYTFGGIQSRGNSPYDIFGDVFLKNVYAVFHQGKQMVGLAQRDD